ncbi:MAG: hypothetical protein AB1477_00290 [Acidobacteriota bacterium]
MKLNIGLNAGGTGAAGSQPFRPSVIVLTIRHLGNLISIFPVMNIAEMPYYDAATALWLDLPHIRAVLMLFFGLAIGAIDFVAIC